MFNFLRRRRDKTHHIVFYTKAGCTLCLQVRDILDDLEDEFDLSIDEIDITTNYETYQRYKEIIPVVIVDDQVTLEGRISEIDLRRALKS